MSSLRVKPKRYLYCNNYCCRWLVTESCQTCLRLPGSSVHGISQAKILEWVAISFSRGSSWPRNRTQASHIAGRCFNLWATRESHPIERMREFSLREIIWEGSPSSHWQFGPAGGARTFYDNENVLFLHCSSHGTVIRLSTCGWGPSEIWPVQ